MTDEYLYKSGADPAYRQLPSAGPHAPLVGGALITWVEPTPEHVAGYNRWYEDDHMITGAMVMPWMFSCRRFVSPRSIQHLRGPVGSRVAEPLEAGKYIGLYWINEGRIEDHQQWSLAANRRLHAEGRGSYRGYDQDPLEERRHIFTSFSDFLGANYRDDNVPRVVHTLVQPYKGLVAQVISAIDGKRDDLDVWLERQYLPSVVDGTVAVATRFAPRPLPPDKLSHVRELEDVEAVVTVLYFLEARPQDEWENHFADAERTIAAGEVGILEMQAAFIPTNHGTDDYVDELF